MVHVLSAGASSSSSSSVVVVVVVVVVLLLLFFFLFFLPFFYPFQTLYDSWLMTLWNLLFTAAPVFGYGFIEKVGIRKKK